MTTLEVAGTYNLRDAGAVAGTPGVLYRSAALDGLEPAGVRRLGDLGVGTVLDLRDASERPLPETDPSWTVEWVPLYDPDTGPPTHGDITDVYRDLLDRRGRQMAAAVAAVARATAPVLVHCTAGKDRTGLVVALALTAAGVPDDAVVDDYARSGPLVRPRREGTARQLLAAQDLTVDQHRSSLELHLDSPASALHTALAHVRDRYGSVRHYLLHHGASAADLARLDERLSPRDDLTLLHVSDIHGSSDAGSSGTSGRIDRLAQVVDHVLGSTFAPDALIVTGDLVHEGDVAAYRPVADALEHAARRLACPVLTVPGNHDDPALLRSVLAPPRVLRVGGFRLVGIDSSSGRVHDDELAWLRAELATPYGRGTILALHHPPIPSVAASLAGRGLLNADALTDAVRGSDVVAVLAGHYHHPMSGHLAGVPVWVGGSLAYLQDVRTGPDAVVGLDAPSYSLVRAGSTGVTFLPMSPTDEKVLFRTSPSATAIAT